MHLSMKQKCSDTCSKGSSAAKFKKQPGAEAEKTFERDARSREALISNDATTYRAMSAHSNFQAQDRPAGSYGLKELCRGFATPMSIHTTSCSGWAATTQARQGLCAAMALLILVPVALSVELENGDNC